MDTLVNIGTNPAILFGKYLVENKKVRPQEALYFVQQLQFHLKEPSQSLFDTIQVIYHQFNFLKLLKWQKCTIYLQDLIVRDTLFHSVILESRKV